LGQGQGLALGPLGAAGAGLQQFGGALGLPFQLSQQGWQTSRAPLLGLLQAAGGLMQQKQLGGKK